jgi:hypothetical protein
MHPIEIIPPRIGGLRCSSLLLFDVVDLLVDKLRHLLTEVNQLTGLLSQYFIFTLEGPQE